jgi:hypothetical protein
MKLKKYDSTTCASTRAALTLPTLSLNPKGIICLNAPLLALTGLQSGDSFSVSQDEEEPDNWYLSKDANGFKLRPYGHESKTKAACINNRALVQVVLKHIGMANADGVVKILVAGKPTMVGKVAYWGILVASAKLSDRGRR